MITNNPALLLPLQDEAAIEIALFLVVASLDGANLGDVKAWLAEMVNRLNFTLRTHGRYPCRYSEYRDLAEHPKDRSEEYRKEATAGSILIPLIAAWLTALGDKGSLKTLVELKKDVLQHCTLQLWIPESASEEHLYLNSAVHGEALADLPLTETGEELLQIIHEACEKSDGFSSLSATTTNFWPIVLTACRHYRLPVPPQFWIKMLRPQKNDQVAA